MADHRRLEDAALLAPPAQGPLTAPALFVCTYVAKLAHLHISVAALTRLLCERPHGCLVAINSNYGHSCQPGFEYLLKRPKPPAARRAPARGRPRKVQGDGTCFNSAVEPVIGIPHPGIPPGKLYMVKCFPTTGETQIPGVVCPDLSDGRAVLAALVAYLNELAVGDPVGEGPAGCGGPAGGAPEGGAPPRHQVTVASQQPKMLNYKFRVVRTSPRILVNLYGLAAYLRALEATKACRGAPLPAQQQALFAGWRAVVLPPHPIRETKPPTDDVKASFRVRGPSRAPRVNVFQEGKVNILGAESTETAQQIYEFFARLLAENWAALVSLQPRRDLERRRLACQSQAAPAAATQAPAAGQGPDADPAPARPAATCALTPEAAEALEEILAELAEPPAAAPEEARTEGACAGPPTEAEGSRVAAPRASPATPQ